MKMRVCECLKPVSSSDSQVSLPEICLETFFMKMQKHGI